MLVVNQDLPNLGFAAFSFGKDVLHKLQTRQPINRRVGIIVAHPDDETIGLGGSLRPMINATLILATDGTPRNLFYAHRNGFESNSEYAAARKIEIQKAIIASGAKPEVMYLGLPDQEVSHHMVSLVKKIMEIARAGLFDVIITQPYEGGHPDHDAVAFAVHTAKRILVQQDQNAPDLVEMTSYHAGQSGEFSTSRFLPNGPAPVTAFLSLEDQRRKREMFECFATQQRALKIFQTDVELFRLAPHYDFSQQAHEGALHYEKRNWNMDSAEWQRLAQNAVTKLHSGR